MLEITKLAERSPRETVSEILSAYGEALSAAQPKAAITPNARSEKFTSDLYRRDLAETNNDQLQLV
jgi:hypothetical protein